MPALWKDVTRYGRRHPREDDPTAWELRGPKIVIYITCDHVDYRGKWIMHCHKLGIKCKPLGVETPKAAQERALQVVTMEINSLSWEISALLLPPLNEDN